MKKPVSQPQESGVQLLTINQVASRLSVNPSTVYGFINRAGLPVTRLARKVVRIDEVDLRAWVAQRKAVS
jgi:excisionase family DNA binding protein